MVFVHVTIDSHVANRADVATLVDGATILHGDGTINVRWGDNTAVRLAEVCSLTDIDWTHRTDDTPGELGLHLVYWTLPINEVLERLTDCGWVEDYVVDV